MKRLAWTKLGVAALLSWPTALGCDNRVEFALDPGGEAGQGGGGEGPTTGQRDFVLDPDGQRPVHLSARPEYVTSIEGGFEIDGDIDVQTPLGPVGLAGAHVSLTYDEDLGTGLQHLEGTSSLALPKMGLLEQSVLSIPRVGTVSYGPGANAIRLLSDGGPLDAHERYLVFGFETEFLADFGSVRLLASGDAKHPAQVAIDANDPIFFFGGSLRGALGETEDVQLTLAPLGTLEHTLERTDKQKGRSVRGQLQLTGAFDFESLGLPLRAESHTLFDLNPGGKGAPFFVDPQSDVTFASWGTLVVRSQLGSTSAVGLEHGTATGNLMPSSTEAAVEGQLKEAQAQVVLAGDVGSKSVDLAGKTPLARALVGDKATPVTVTDADLCGTEAVTSEALCGTRTVTDADKCGQESVTSAELCGTHSVRDATQCGTVEVTSAADCGTHVVTDGEACGFIWSTNLLDCGCLPLLCDGCYIPGTCTIPNTCIVAATCEVPSTCQIAKSCEVAAECQQPLTCETTHIESDVRLGTLTGEALVTFDDKGLGGTLDAKFCPENGGTCRSDLEGRVRLAETRAEVCFDIGTGESCEPL
jgi:hypothetical protein